MTSILDEFFRKWRHPDGRWCDFCGVRCPTDIGRPLPDGWRKGDAWLDSVTLLCPPCAKMLDDIERAADERMRK